MRNSLPLLFRTLILMGVIMFSGKLASGQSYCQPAYSTGTTAGDYITRVWIDSIDNQTGAASSPFYTYYQGTSTTLKTGYSYYLKVAPGTWAGNGNNIAAWIDYNQNDTFETSEKLGQKNNMAASTLDSIFFFVANNAKPGLTRMRVREVYNNTNIDPCNSANYGEAEDYDIYIDSVACTSPPSAGTVNGGNSAFCFNTNVSLYLTGSTMGSGLTVQWQSSPDSVNWSDISGANTLSYSFSMGSSKKYYRAYVVCSGSADTTSGSLVDLKPASLCYCTPLHSNTCNANNIITNVSFPGLTLNQSTSSCNGTVPYFDYTSYLADSLHTDSTYSFSVTTSASDIISVWIDYNQDGTFSSSEWQQVTTSSTANTATTISITIPSTAVDGITGMRVRSRAVGNTNGAGDACTNFGSGSTQDYLVYIIQPPCSSPPTAGNTISSADTACPSAAVNFSLQGNTYGNGQTYQWQVSSDNINWTNINGANRSTFITSSSTSQYYRAYLTCGGSTDTATSKFVFINSFLNCYCTAAHGNNCSAADLITNVTIQGTNLNNSVSTCPGTVPYYFFSPNVASQTAYLIRGQAYTLDVTTNNNNIISVWIDFNQNGSFEASEWTQVSTTSISGTANSVTINIPAGAAVGQTGMRIRSRLNSNPNGANDACLSFGSGVSHDYFVSINDSYDTDAGMDGAIAPSSYACYGNAETFTVRIKNFGKDTIDLSTNNVTVSLDVNDGSTVQSLDTTLTSGTLLPNDTLQITFNGTIDLSLLSTNYQVKVYTTMNNDSNVNNDSLKYTISTVNPINLPYRELFDNSASIPTSLTNNGLIYSNNGGMGSSGSLRANMSGTKLFAYGTFPVVGSLSSKSVLQFNYRSNAQLSTDDSLIIVASFDCGKNYTTLYRLDNSNTNSNSFTKVVYNLGNYAGSNILLGLVSLNNSVSTFNIDIDDVVIADIPEINVGMDTNSCDPIKLMAIVNGTSNYNLTWNTGSNFDTVTVFNSGAYYCTVTDVVSGLTATDTVNVGIYTAPVVNLGGSKTGCSAAGIMLDAGSFGAGYTYLWNTGATTQTITAYSNGTYSCTVTSPGGCSGSDNATITLTWAPTGVSIIQGTPFNGKYNAGTLSNPDGVCSGNTVVYELTPPTGYNNAGYGTDWTIRTAWLGTLNNNQPSTGSAVFLPPSSSNGTLTFTPTSAEEDSLYIIYVTVRDSVSGCDTTVMRALQVYGKPVVSIGTDQTVCPGTQATFDAGTFASYEWSNSATTQSINVTAPGTYWVKVTNGGGCENFDTAELKNYTVTPLNLGADKFLCPGASIILDAGTAQLYNWSNGANTQTITVNSPGAYWGEITDNQGCKSRDTIQITAASNPDASFTSQRVNNLSTNVQFTAADQTAGNTYAWDFGDGGQSTQANPLHVYAANGSYTVKLKVTNTNTCVDADSSSLSVNTGVISMSNNTGIMVIPNPYKGQTQLTINTDKSRKVQVRLLDMSGKQIQQIWNGNTNSHGFILTVNTSELNQGIYILEIRSDDEVSQIKIVDLK